MTAAGSAPGPDAGAASDTNPGAASGAGSRAGPIGGARQLRLVVTAPDYDEALRFYRDVLGLPEEAAFVAEGGRVTILDAGRATLEITDPRHAAYIDEVEVGRRVAGHIRVAFEVDDARTATDRLAEAGATVIAPPTVTPWQSLNARLEGPAGLQLTLFTELGPAEA
jgi:predicted enzyme related to lactoylglutathione lyase